MTGVVDWTEAAGSVGNDDAPAALGPANWDEGDLEGVPFDTGKGYDFFAAVAGMRNRFGRQELFTVRGRPQRVSGPARMYFDFHGENVVGWLHLSEIDAAVRHIAAGEAFHMGYRLELTLSLMRTLV